MNDLVWPVRLTGQAVDSRKLQQFRSGFTILVWCLASLMLRSHVLGDDSRLPGGTQELPAGELGRVIRLGREIVEQTHRHPLSKPFVGNTLTCSSCHLNAGTHGQAASFLGVATAYPAWSARDQRVITLEDRVQNCFMRSQNGFRPEHGSPVSIAVTAYITWLSAGEKIAMNPDAPLGPRSIKPLTLTSFAADLPRGKVLFTEKCAHCHAEDGIGTAEGPPVWGDNSYNDGAGLAKVNNLAAWLKVAMPLDDATLTEQEAIDLAAFVNSHPRPHFVFDEHILPVERSRLPAAETH